MIDFSIKITLSLLMVVFVVILAGMFVPGVGTGLFEIAGPLIVFSEWGIFSLLGAGLIVLTLKQKIKRPFKKYLLLTGSSAVGFFVFVILHNLVSGLLGIEEPVFFLLAVFVCPLGFLIGAIGSIVLVIRQKN
jgi:hypothetical protein